MKKLFFTLLFLSVFIGSAQSTNKILFHYDAAGNQITRELCMNCSPGKGKKVIPVEEIRKEDLIKSDVSDKISYYPNPVSQELFLKWELVNDNSVSAIQLYSISGQLIQSSPINKDVETAIVGFQNYPQGYYILTLNYQNGEQKSIKIVKK